MAEATGKAHTVSDSVHNLIIKEPITPFAAVAGDSLQKLPTMEEFKLGCGQDGANGMNQTASSKPGSCLRTQKTQLEYDEYVASADNKPYVSCRSFVVMDSYHSKILQSKNPDEVREMASLTKMITAYVSIELAKELNYDLQHTFFNVSLKAA